MSGEGPIGYPGVSMVKSLPANAGDTEEAVLIPGSGRSSGKGNGNLLQYSCLENPMDREVWGAMIHGVTKGLNTTEWLNNNT